MTGEDRIESACNRIQARRPELSETVRIVADVLTAGSEDVEAIHQAALQRFLWYYLPRDYPDSEWEELWEATTLLLAELDLPYLTKIATAELTQEILSAWADDPSKGADAFQKAYSKSGIEPPDTETLQWGAILGADELRAFETVERALSDAIAAGQLVPGARGWRIAAAAVTEKVLTLPLDAPPGQTLANLVTTERVGTWIDLARHPTHQRWRSNVANRLLHPIEPPTSPETAIAPMMWLLELAAAPRGAALTQSHYLARTAVLDAVERFSWWPWEKPPRSEADIHQISLVRNAATRLRLLRRTGQRPLLTARGRELLDDPGRLWTAVATETATGDDFTRAITELIGLRLLQGEVEIATLVADVTPILISQGWSSGGEPVTTNRVSSEVYSPLHWWRLFDALVEVEATREHGTYRELTPHTIVPNSNGERMILAYLRSRAAGPLRHFGAEY
ncbi:MAG: hypothetical protein ACP5O0_04720 [Acidimicrobiales bacterium]